MQHPTIVAAVSAEQQQTLRARAAHQRLVKAARGGRPTRRRLWSRSAGAALPVADVVTAGAAVTPAASAATVVTQAVESPRAAA